MITAMGITNPILDVTPRLFLRDVQPLHHSLVLRPHTVPATPSWWKPWCQLSSSCQSACLASHELMSLLSADMYGWLALACVPRCRRRGSRGSPWGPDSCHSRCSDPRVLGHQCRMCRIEDGFASGDAGLPRKLDHAAWNDIGTRAASEDPKMWD